MAALKGFMNRKLGWSSKPAHSSNDQDQFSPVSNYIEEDPTVGEWLRGTVPNGAQVVEYLWGLFPFSAWIFSYNLQWFIGDLIAGITVGLVVIPQGMAYAKLAQLPVQFGLYTSFMGALVYWIFGTSKDINIGPVAVLSIVTGSIVADARKVLPKEYEPWVIASALAFISGAFVTLIGLLRLGWLVDFIALPAVSGFITGSALTIGLGQIPTMLGMRGVSSSDPAYLILVNILRHLHTIRMDAATGISALCTLYLIKLACERASKRWPSKSKPIFFLSTLRTVFILLLFTLISFVINRSHRRHPKFSIIGFIPSGFRDATVPRIDSNLLNALLPSLPAAFVVLLIEHISIAKSFGRVNNYTIDPSQEILAIGVTNILGPFLGAYPATGSFSRTAIKSKAGVRTPFAGVVAAGIVLLAIYALTPVFFYVPTSSLAAVIIHAVGDLITAPSTLITFWKISPTDFIIFFIGLGVIIFSSIEHGVFAMIGLSAGLLLLRLFKARGRFMGTVSVHIDTRFNDSKKNDDSNPLGDVSPVGSSGSVLVQAKSEPSRMVFLPLGRDDGSNPLIRIDQPGPGIFIYRFSQDFNYTNANSYIDHMLGVVCRQTRLTTRSTATKAGDRSWNDPALRRNTKTKAKEEQEDRKPTLKAIILDFSSVNHVDITSVQLLVDARNLLDRHAAPHAVQWHFANIHSRWTKRALGAAGFGFPSQDATNGHARHWKSVFSVAEIVSSDNDTDEEALKDDDKRMTQDIELAQIWQAEPEQLCQQQQQQEQGISRISFDKSLPTVVTTERIGCEGRKLGVLEDPESEFDRRRFSRISFDKGNTVRTERLAEVKKAAVHGVNRPFFHVTLEAALQCAIANVVPV